MLYGKRLPERWFNFPRIQNSIPIETFSDLKVSDLLSTMTIFVSHPCTLIQQSYSKTATNFGSKSQKTFCSGTVNIYSKNFKVFPFSKSTVNSSWDVLYVCIDVYFTCCLSACGRVKIRNNSYIYRTFSNVSKDFLVSLPFLLVHHCSSD